MKCKELTAVAASNLFQPLTVPDAIIREAMSCHLSCFLIRPGDSQTTFAETMQLVCPKFQNIRCDTLRSARHGCRAVLVHTLTVRLLGSWIQISPKACTAVSFLCRHLTRQKLINSVCLFFRVFVALYRHRGGVRDNVLEQLQFNKGRIKLMRHSFFSINGNSARMCSQGNTQSTVCVLCQ